MLGYFDSEIWKALWRWAKRRHINPRLGAGRVKKKYFRTHQGRTWTFFAKIKDRRGNPKYIHICRANAIPIKRHVKVKGIASPDDPSLKKYWKDRQTEYGKSYWTKGSKLYNVAETQKWKCPICGEHLFNGEELHTHHIVRVKDDGTDKEDNLVHVHKACHQYLHKGERSELPEA